jgi:CheY-like chemotaxis protein
MLGVTTYQEALRALGALMDATATSESVEVPDLRIVELPERACLEIRLQATTRCLGAGALRDVVLASRARRGAAAAAGPVSDILRSVGLALDELAATSVDVELRAGALHVQFMAEDQRHLHYDRDEVEALRRAAVARRKGDPLRRVLILHSDAASAAPLRELLVAEFAVQSLPTVYARAVAEAGDPPDAVLAEVGAVPGDAIEALAALKSSERTADVPVVLIAPPEAGLDPSDAFAAGADDLLPMPYQPAQLRARLRTWLLRRRAS